MNNSTIRFYLKNQNIVYPIILVLLAIFLRFWGITYGLPSVYNSTEYFIAKHALSFGARHTLEPLYFIYPTLYPYFIAVLFGFYYLVGHLSGAFPGTADFAVQFFMDPTPFYLIGRMSSAIIFIIALLIFYKITRYYLDAKNGFLISLLFLFTYNVQFFTFWMVPDGLLLLGAVVVLYYIVKIQKRKISDLELIFASLVCGLTISTKYNAGFLALGWLTAVWLFSVKARKTKIRRTLFSGVGILAGFLIGSPYWVIKFSRFEEGFGMIFSQSQFAYNLETGKPYLWEIQKLISSEWLLGVLFVLLLFSMLFQYKKQFIPFTAIIIPTFLLVGSWEKKGLDYLLIIFPALLVVLLLFIEKYRAKFPLNSRLTFILMPILIINGARLYFHDYQKEQEDTREMTGAWIVQNYPPGSRICYDHYHYDINLIDVNRFLDYGAGSRFLDENIRTKLEKLRNAPNNYSFISAQKKIEKIDLPDSLFTIIENDTFLRQSFLHPHKSLAELKAEGVKLLILNSDTYLKFLNNPAPDSSNPLRSDFLFRRNFYQKVLKQFSPIIKFQPDLVHLGPVIQIFDLEDK